MYYSCPSSNTDKSRPDMKQIIESPLPEDQKVFLFDQLLQKYQGLTNQMKTETTIKPTVGLPKADPLPTTDSSGDQSQLKHLENCPRHLKQHESQKFQGGKKLMPLVSPEEMTLPLMLDSPPDSARKSSRRKPRTPIVARLRSNKQWEPY